MRRSAISVLRFSFSLPNSLYLDGGGAFLLGILRHVGIDHGIDDYHGLLRIAPFHRDADEAVLPAHGNVQRTLEEPHGRITAFDNLDGVLLAPGKVRIDALLEGIRLVLPYRFHRLFQDGGRLDELRLRGRKVSDLLGSVPALAVVASSTLGPTCSTMSRDWAVSFGVASSTSARAAAMHTIVLSAAIQRPRQATSRRLPVMPCTAEGVRAGSRCLPASILRFADATDPPPRLLLKSFEIGAIIAVWGLGLGSWVLGLRAEGLGRRAQVSGVRCQASGVEFQGKGNSVDTTFGIVYDTTMTVPEIVIDTCVVIAALRSQLARPTSCS